MPDSSNQNPWRDARVSGQGASGMPKIAPPPVEVAIRTMESDIASLGQSGGGPPRPENITLPSLKVEEIAGKPPFAFKEKSGIAKEGETAFGAPTLRYSIIAGSILAGAAIVFLASYYIVYPLLGRLKSSAPTAPAPTSTAPSANARPNFKHHSFFKNAADETFAISISSSVGGFGAVRGQLETLLAGAASSSAFFEIEAQSSDGKPLSANEFFSLLNGGVLEERFLVSAFNPDFTVFLHTEKTVLPANAKKTGAPVVPANLWPGYILQLSGNQSPLLLKSDVMKIESASSNWENLFLQPPGTPAAAFRDALVSGQPVRVLNFSDGKSVLAYGWFFNKYLIISTSLDGLKQAISHF